MVNITLFSATAIFMLLVLHNSKPKKEGDKHDATRTK